jgi:hypothetical protein
MAAFTTIRDPVQAGPRLAGRRKLLGSLGPWTGPDPVQVR